MKMVNHTPQPANKHQMESKLHFNITKLQCNRNYTATSQEKKTEKTATIQFCPRK